MKRALTGILLATTVVATGMLVLMARDRDRLVKEAVQSGLAQKNLENEMLRLRGELDRTNAELKKVQAAAITPSSPDTTIANAQATKAGNQEPKATPKQGMKAWAEMLQKPEMREMAKQQQIAMMDSQYSGLFARFNFDEAEKADFKRLLSDRQSAEMDLGIKVMNGDLNADQRNALANESEAAKKAVDARIREFLNSDEDYAVFEKWEETKGERMRLDMGRNIFASSGEPLSPAQEDQLINTMHDVSRRPTDTPDLSKPQNFDPANMTPADIERQLAAQDKKAQAVLEASAAFLSPKQLESLGTMQKQWRSMSEAGLKMSAAMLKTSPAAGAKP